MTPQDILAHWDSGRLWPARADAQRPTDLAAAYQQALAVLELRMARGERPLGFKIGFTNRTIWERYRVFAPIWGPVWDTTVRHCESSGMLDLDGLCQPRLEPEVAFSLRATPPLNASLEELFDCVDWPAPSFEIVHTHCADWKFTAAETVADGALHGRLLIGRPTPVRVFADHGEALDAMLAATRVRLYRGDTLIEEGLGRNVLDGPLHALRHFVLEMQRCPGAPGLHRGDMISTGTWTDAQPLQAGTVWRSDFDAPLPGLQVAIT